jgi:hypothetical protein
MGFPQVFERAIDPGVKVVKRNFGVEDFDVRLDRVRLAGMRGDDRINRLVGAKADDLAAKFAQDGCLIREPAIVGHYAMAARNQALRFPAP